MYVVIVFEGQTMRMNLMIISMEKVTTEHIVVKCIFKHRSTYHLFKVKIKCYTS